MYCTRTLSCVFLLLPNTLPQPNKWFIRCKFSGTADSKSYVLVSELPTDVYKKYVEDVNTSHLIGFTFAIIGIVHLAGGKIAEGMVAIEA